MKLQQDCLWTQGLKWALLGLHFHSLRVALWLRKAPNLGDLAEKLGLRYRPSGPEEKVGRPIPETRCIGKANTGELDKLGKWYQI